LLTNIQNTSVIPCGNERSRHRQRTDIEWMTVCLGGSSCTSVLGECLKLSEYQAKSNEVGDNANLRGERYVNC
jgi:hypothetical protein